MMFGLQPGSRKGPVEMSSRCLAGRGVASAVLRSYWGGIRRGLLALSVGFPMLGVLMLGVPHPTAFQALRQQTGNSMESRRSSFSYEELLACGRGELFNEGPQLPLPPMLMFDRISEIAEKGGEYGKGLVRAVLEVRPDLWFFPCHFKGDPVMPGCLGLDALWQLLGFFLGWLGSPGKGRALGIGEIKFSGQVLPNVKEVIYGIEIKRVMRSKLVLGIADGWLKADGSIIYRAMDLKVGLFRNDEAMQPSEA